MGIEVVRISQFGNRVRFVVAFRDCGGKHRGAVAHAFQFETFEILSKGYSSQWKRGGLWKTLGFHLKGVICAIRYRFSFEVAVLLD
jgi:hypothetical protein